MKLGGREGYEEGREEEEEDHNMEEIRKYVK
jgi:hypothetical protein